MSMNIDTLKDDGHGVVVDSIRIMFDSCRLLDPSEIARARTEGPTIGIFSRVCYKPLLVDSFINRCVSAYEYLTGDTSKICVHYTNVAGVN